MIIRILNNKYIGEREKYVIEFMLNTLGYFYDWISEDDNPAQSEILLCYRPINHKNSINPNTVYIPKIFDLENLMLSNINWQAKEIKGTVIPLLNVQDSLQNDDETPQISFDIIANIYYHLTRVEETDFGHPKQIDEKVENAVLYKYGQFKKPLVDIILKYFDDILQKHLLSINPFFIKKCANPQGEDFGVALTHDVDIIRAYHPLKKAVLSLLYRLKLSKFPSPQEMNSADDRIWGFDTILDFYHKNSWKGVFFFIARYREDRHFRYRLKNRKIRAVIERIKKEGHEIAWHPSRYAFEHPKRYDKELARLKKISNYEVSGMRHHYLRCLFPQIWLKAEELGLSYDAGLTYRRYGGFRAGTTHPFSTFDHKQGRMLKIWEFPTAFFEASIHNETEQISAVINTVKENSGLLNIIWHTNNFYQENEYYPLWVKIIKEIKKHKIYVATLKEHLKWQQQRSNITIKKIKTDNKQVKIIFNIQDKLQTLSLKIISAGDNIKVKKSEIYSIKETGNIIIIHNKTPFDSIVLDFYLK